ncbi:MAG TPA: hypothetical protein VF359_09780 [Anaerolineales bacterium]
MNSRLVSILRKEFIQITRDKRTLCSQRWNPGPDHSALAPFIRVR